MPQLPAPVKSPAGRGAFDLPRQYLSPLVVLMLLVAIAALSGDVLVSHVRTMTQQIEDSLVRERALARLSSGLGAPALFLAGLGLYALIGYDVTRRSREIGIRMALGATRVSVLLRVVRDALAVSAIGIVLGLLGALAATRTVSTFLFGPTPRDPLTLAGVAALLLTTALVAGILPARRAASVDPGRVLKTE